MSGILSLLGAGSRANKPISASVALRTQSSLEGRPRAIGAGQNRLAGNIIWYGDYKATPVSAGGKGGAFSGKGGTQAYKYSASFQVSIGETIAAVQAISNGSLWDFFYAVPAALKAQLLAKGIKVTTGNTFGGTFLLGDYAQSPWSYLVTAHPTQALNYRGEALACFPNLALGQSPSLPNFNFEVLWAINTDVAAFGPDANPADWVAAFLTNADWGAGFPSVLLGDLDGYRSWSRASSLLISPLLDGQVAGNSHLTDLMQGTISDFVWSSGILTVVPYADANITGNGETYVAPVAPVYDLDEVDFLPVEHGPETGDQQVTVKIARADPTTLPNKITVEYLDRANLYNPVSIHDQDDAAIILSGRPPRPSDPRQHHFFASAVAASRSAPLQLRRERVLQSFYFHLPPQFVLLDPMDIVTLTQPSLGLSATPVRITEITRSDDGSLNFTAEEFFGATAPTIYARQDPLGTGRNANQDPGGVNTPIIFEPPEALGQGLKIWMGISGADLSIWGGCNVWVATESGGTYQQVGQITGSARMGKSTAILPTIVAAANGQTVDNTNTLSVTLVESDGELASGSVADMTAQNTASYIGGEIIAYQNATLTGPNAYDLAPMVRGAYGTIIDAHAVGSDFLRLDDLPFEIVYTADRIGSQMYIKLQSFNIYGGGLQDLADLGPVAYTIQGTALSSPLADIANLRATYVDNTSAITWDEVDDFRIPFYEIRRGASWEVGLNLGLVAHPPFVTRGDGMYWVKARVEPVAGLIVYSTNALGVTLAGTVLPANIIGTYDEAGGGWTGTITGPGAIDGANFVTTASGTVAYYEVPDAHVFDVLFDRPIRVDVEWSAQGVAAGADILSDPDFLNNPDMFGSAATASIDSWTEIFVTGGEAGDVYAAGDVYDLPDVYGGSTGAWVKFAPGVQFGRRVKARIAIISYSDAVQAVATAFKYSTDVPTRVDHMTNYALGAPGETFQFTPDGSASPVAFKFGPNGATYPQVFVAIQDQSAGDYWTATAEDLSEVTIRCFNAGVGVARTVNITFEGA